MPSIAGNCSTIDHPINFISSPESFRDPFGCTLQRLSFYTLYPPTLPNVFTSTVHLSGCEPPFGCGSAQTGPGVHQLAVKNITSHRMVTLPAQAVVIEFQKSEKIAHFGTQFYHGVISIACFGGSSRPPL